MKDLGVLSARTQMPDRDLAGYVSAMTKRKKPRSRNPAPPKGHKRPSHQIRAMIELSKTITSETSKHLESGYTADAEAAFDWHVLRRGLDALQSVKLLVGANQWEFAAASSRQLFELLINMEYMAGKEDRLEQVGAFVHFGQLQGLVAAIGRYDYERITGVDVDESRLLSLEKDLANPVFEKFRGKPRSDGSVRWARSWNGKDARSLAEGSSVPIRLNQYELLFSSWSEQAHGAPAALIGQMLKHDAQKRGDMGSHEYESSRGVEVLSMAIALFVELWSFLPKAPPLGPATAAIWFQEMRDIASPLVRAEFQLDV